MLGIMHHTSRNISELRTETIITTTGIILLLLMREVDYDARTAVPEYCWFTAILLAAAMLVSS